MSKQECLLCLRTPIENLLDYSKQLYVDDLIASNVSNRAAKLIYSAYEKAPYELCGMRPKSIMASALYLSCMMEGDKVSQRVVAVVVGVTAATIRHLNKRFIKVLNLELFNYRAISMPSRARVNIERIEAKLRSLDEKKDKSIMKFVLSDELEEIIRSKFRKKGDLSKIAELALRKHLGMNIPNEIQEE